MTRRYLDERTVSKYMGDFIMLQLSFDISTNDIPLSEGSFRKFETTFDVGDARTTFRGRIIAIDITTDRVFLIPYQLEDLFDARVALPPRHTHSRLRFVFQVQGKHP